MRINEQTLKEIDNNIKLIPLTYDFSFKSVFNKNLELLKEFLIDVLHLEYQREELDIRILNNELPKEIYSEYQKRIDVNIVLNDDIYVEIEINKENFELVKYRNKMYADKLYSMLLESGENARKLEYIRFYQLNLNTENKSEKVGEYIIVPYNISTDSVYISNEQTILKYLEFYYRLYYNEPKKRTRDVIWLASLNAKSFTELYQILKGVLANKELTKFLKDVINMSLEDFNLHEWQREKLDDLVAYNREQYAMKTGIEQNTIDIVKELLKNNIEIDIISKVTKKSIDEIKNIEESIKEDIRLI